MKYKENIINKIIPILLLIIVSSFLVFYKFSGIPKGLTHDENELARAAFSLENKPYTPFTPVADGHGTPYFYTLLLSFKIFGVNQFALRLPSRIFGIVSVLLFYLILKMSLRGASINERRGNLFNKIASLIARNDILAFILSLILLTTHWYLNFVRFSFEMPFLLFLELSSIYLFFSYFDKKKLIYLVFSGVFAGIAYNSYQPGRIFFLLPLFFLFVKKEKLKQVASYIIPFIVLILPISIYLLMKPTSDIRINQQLYLKNTELTWQKKVDFFSQNIQSTTLMLFTKGDINGRHNYPGKPALNPILGVLATLGFILTIIHWKKFHNLFFLSYLLISIAPTLLTYPWENPNMLRTYTALPSIIYFLGIALIYITNFINKFVKIKLFRYLILTTCYLLLLSSSFYELRTYFKYQPLVFEYSFNLPDQLKLIQEGHSVLP